MVVAAYLLHVLEDRTELCVVQHLPARPQVLDETQLHGAHEATLTLRHTLHETFLRPRTADYPQFINTVVITAVVVAMQRTMDFK